VSEKQLGSLTRFGDPVLREKTRKLSVAEIRSEKYQKLINDMRRNIQSKNYGVGLAAPQIGKSARIAVIDIKPTKLRPHAENFSLIMVNPSYKGVGQRRSKWEGCLSSGSGKNTLYAKALRYSKIDAVWTDENGKTHKKTLQGLPAHVFQHETDHLDGILFVDRVRDSKTYMMADEYHKRIQKKSLRVNLRIEG
jgi:peptide deformylase